MRELAAERKRLKQEALEASKLGFKSMSDGLFNTHPDLESFTWRQYTLYFNDGDACTFSARKEDMESIDFLFTDGTDGDAWMSETIYVADGVENSTWGTRTKYKQEPNAAFDAAKVATAEAVLEFLAHFNDEVLEEMFGDHVAVTVSREGVSVDEYTNHD